MNLKGKIVQVNIPEDMVEVISMNNNQKTAVAIVVADWNPNSNGQDKLLNVKLVLDGPKSFIWVTSIHHVFNGPKNQMTWELLDEEMPGEVTDTELKVDSGKHGHSSEI